ncbi:MAG: dihydrofolate reductase family protein [Patescibacteria group bacterium]
MSKVILYIAVTVDGYIADKDGGVDWLQEFQVSKYDYGFEDFYADIGSIVMGSITYEQVLSFGVEWPYSGVKTYVLSHRELPAATDSVSFYHGDLTELVERLKYEGNIWLVGGGQVVSQFINLNLVDEIQLAVIPVLLGKGIPLFREFANHLKLELTQNQVFDNGAMLVKYRIRK